MAHLEEITYSLPLPRNDSIRKKHLVTIFVRLQSLDLFFLCFSAFLRVPMSFFTFVSTFIMGIIYFILAWKGVKTIKLKKMFFFYSPLKISVIGIVVLHQLRKLQLEWKGR